MKTGKTIVSVLVMAVVLSCSLFPVFAIGAVKKTASASFQGPNVNYFASVRATQYQGVGTAGNGTSTSAYVGESQIVVTVSFFNDGDDPWFLDGVYVRLNDSSTATHNLTDFDIIGGNLTVAQTGTPYSFSIFGGENNSYNDGFVVAPHSNLTVAFSVAAFATSDSGVGVFSLNTVSFGASTNSVGDYPYGLDVDFSPLIDYLNSDVVPELLDQGLTLDSIVSLLQSWTVSSSSFNLGSGYLAEKTNNHNQDNVQYLSRFLMLQPVLYDRVVETTPNGSLYSYTFRCPILFFFSLTNIGTERLKTTSESFTLNQYAVLPNNCNYGGLEVSQYTDNVNIDSFSYSSSAFRTKFYFSSTKGLILEPGQRWSGSLIAYVYLYVDSSTPLTSFTPNFTFTDLTFPNLLFSEYITDAETDMNTIHDQEQQWYQQNEAAIESTGLANYSFTTNQISGIGTIASQFSSVWNALGDWTLIYIFVLTLSLATFILRHRPSTKMQQRVSSMEREQFINKAVRSQRDSLYRHYWERYHK